jgi:multiple sugar transport system permease protein
MRWRNTPPWVWLLTPALVFVLAMAVFPLAYSFLLSLRDWKLAQTDSPGDWVGFSNYIGLLTDDPEFLDSVKVTAVFVFWDVLATLIFALGVGLLLKREGKIYSITRVLLLLPFVMSPAVIGISFKFFLNAEYGILQFLLGWLFPALEGKVWLSDSTLAMVAVVASDVWHWAPYMTLVMLGGLASIPKETEEAARVDGAGSFRVFWDVTLPQLWPVIGIVAILKTVFALKAFDSIYTLSNGGPGTSTQTLAYYIYNTAFGYYDMGYAAAAAYILTATLLCVAVFYLRLVLKK